jgi:hypothetical protein
VAEGGVVATTLTLRASDAGCRNALGLQRSFADTMSFMNPTRHPRGIRARVEAGRIVIDEPTDLPEGTVLDLVVDDEGDTLTPEERARLGAALDRGIDDASAGRTTPAANVINRLRNRA